jgi:hypothetical protein
MVAGRVRKMNLGQTVRELLMCPRKKTLRADRALHRAKVEKRVRVADMALTVEGHLRLTLTTDPDISFEDIQSLSGSRDVVVCGRHICAEKGRKPSSRSSVNLGHRADSAPC